MLRIIYRVCGAENNKARPIWYSKRRCLRSLLEARKKLSASSLLIVSDGPMPTHLADAIGDSGSIMILSSVGNAESFLDAFAVAAMWPDADAVYFVEDDYIHTTDALTKLEEAFHDVPFDYITLYDHPDRYLPVGHARRDLQLHNNNKYESRSHTWRTVESTCMTFATRVSTMKEDLGVFLAHVVPGHVPRDRSLFRHLQGLGPYERAPQRRTLLGPLPSLATHCETAYLAPGVDWGTVACQL